jgi:beta-lactam-binding protein with PASTA domain
MSSPASPKTAKLKKVPKSPRNSPGFLDLLRLLWKNLKRLVKRALPTANDDQNARLFKKMAWSLTGMAFLMVFFAFTAFFFSLKGQEETMVPKVVGKDLVSAILDLQEKELVPVVQVKFSTDPRDKGNVIGQDPQGGLLSKSGRQVTLWVSKGAIVDTVENFVGMNVNDVQLHLKTLFASQAQPLITLGNDPTYINNSAPEGTVLEQQPVAGTSLSAPVALKMIVSRGPKGQTVKVGAYTNQSWTDALVSLSADNFPFQISLRKADPNEKPGQFVSQAPVAGAELAKGTPINLTLTEPTPLPDGRVFRLLVTTLPEYPIMIDLKVTLKKLSAESVILLQMKHPGGVFHLPYFGTPGDIITIQVLDKDVFSQKVE